MDPWVDQSLDEFIQGYKKIVSNKKAKKGYEAKQFDLTEVPCHHLSFPI